LAKVTSCTADATATTLASVVSCDAGFAPWKLSTGTWRGCLHCAGMTNTDTASTT